MSAFRIVVILLMLFSIAKLIWFAISFKRMKPPKVDPTLVEQNNQSYSDNDDDDWDD